MKILKRRGEKDYYDFLEHTRGLDSKIVFDRTKSERADKYLEFFREGFFKITIAFCGKYYDGLMVILPNESRKFYWGDKRLDFENSAPNEYFRRYREPKGFKQYVYESYPELELKLEPYKILHPENLESPIMLSVSGNQVSRFYSNKYGWTKGNYEGKSIRVEFPNLADIGFGSIVSPEEAWDTLYNYFSAQYDKELEDNRTDEEKIINKGMSTKFSFRNMKRDN